MAGAPHLEAFINAARYFIGLEESGENTFTDPRGIEMFTIFGGGWGSAWCAILVSVCAIKADIDWVIIAPNSGVGGVTSNTVDYLDGVWIDGPYHTGANVTPIPGDLITFVGSPASDYSSYEHAGHIGIVEYVDEDGVHTIEGNSGNACRQNVYALNYSEINGYCRPNWAAVGDDVSAYTAGVGGIVGPLYQTRNDRHDMTLREVGYLDGNYKLTNKQTEVSISVINYTTLLGDLYSKFGGGSVGGVQVNTSQLTGNVKIAMDMLLKIGFNASTASGLTGCLLVYSNISPTFSVTKASGLRLEGVAAWEPEVIAKVKARLGYGWNINLSGQLQFFVDDLQINYKDLLVLIKDTQLSHDDARNVANAVMVKYNKHYIYGEYIEKAKQNAADIYGQLIITQASLVGDINNLRDEDGNLLEAKYSVEIPTDFTQSGIINDFTSYSYMYHRWVAGTNQRRLADIWYYQGCPYDKAIALVSGYYCIAVREYKFGVCGDVVVVTLSDGNAFAAIIADEKGSDAQHEWGHVFSSGVSIVEWEKICTYNGEVLTEGASASIVDNPGFGDWAGKSVVRITNYGSYFS